MKKVLYYLLTILVYLPLVTFFAVCWIFPIIKFLVELISGAFKKKPVIRQVTTQTKTFAEQRQQFISTYGGKRLSEIAPPQNSGDHIGPDGYPCGPGPEKWGTNYTVYITSSKSAVYHRQRFCSTSLGSPINIVCAGSRRPCSKCFKSPPPDLTWYQKQKQILRQCEVYDFTLEPESFDGK